MRLTVLGATGSIGLSTLDLVGRAPERFDVVALTAQSNAKALAELAQRHRARLAVIGDEALYGELRQHLSGTGIVAAAGREALIEAALEPADCIMAAIVGAAGLAPSLAGLRKGVRLALANKECLVSAGDLFMAEAARREAELVPVDSEHSAAFQLVAGRDPGSIEKMILTASGGPFREWTAERIAAATREQALRHPNWSMGAKITIDSATMMNKGLELIEARHLFGLGPERLGVVVHPQSIVHCLVSFADGSVLAQLSEPDMRTPIGVALAWPGRMTTPVKRLDLAALGQLTFEAPDEVRFPALRLARQALAAGGAAPAVLNAANEVAVAAFLSGRIGFGCIAGTVEECLAAAAGGPGRDAMETLEEVMAVDAHARRIAAEVVDRRAR